MMYAFIAMWYVIGLCGYHVHLVSINQSTNEKIKEIWKTPFANPFDRGSCLLNIRDAIRSSNYPSRFNLFAPSTNDLEHISISPTSEALKIPTQYQRVDNLIQESSSDAQKSPPVDLSQDEPGPTEILSINVTEGTTTRGPSYSNLNKNL